MEVEEFYNGVLEATWQWGIASGASPECDAGGQPKLQRNATTASGQRSSFRGRRGGGWRLGYVLVLLRDRLKSLFLPEGYPASVPPEYLAFQFWDSLQALCSYVRGVVSGNALLVGVGLGNGAASALSATVAFVIKDLSGMVGGLVFTWVQGPSLDSYDKQYRLLADLSNNLGLALELATSSAPPALFLTLACLGSIARAVTGIAGAATRAALTQHFALRRNAADIAAKEWSQETATVLAGMVLGLGVTHAATGRPAVAWAAFLILMVLHVYANVRALRCLRMASFNRPRTNILIRQYMSEGTVPTPEAVASVEPLSPPPLATMAEMVLPPSRTPTKVLLGAPASYLATAWGDSGGGGSARGEPHTRQQQQSQGQQQPGRRITRSAARQSGGAHELQQQQQQQQQEEDVKEEGMEARRRYIVTAKEAGGSWPSLMPGGLQCGSSSSSAAVVMAVVLDVDASDRDVLMGYAEARLAADQIDSWRRGGQEEGQGQTGAAMAPRQQQLQALTAAAASIESRWGSFECAARVAGWQLDRVTLAPGPWRCRWRQGAAAAATTAVPLSRKEQ